MMCVCVCAFIFLCFVRVVIFIKEHESKYVIDIPYRICMVELYRVTNQQKKMELRNILSTLLLLFALSQCLFVVDAKHSTFRQRQKRRHQHHQHKQKGNFYFIFSGFRVSEVVFFLLGSGRLT